MNELWFSFTMDKAPPEVISATPTDGSVEAPLNTEIVVEFSEPMDTDSVGSALSISPYAEKSFDWSSDNTVLTIEILAPLDHETRYSITIGTGAEDTVGKSMESEYSFGFTTVKGPDTEDGKDGSKSSVLMLTLLSVIIIIIIIAVLLIGNSGKKAKKEGGRAQLGALPQTISCPDCSRPFEVTGGPTPMKVQCPFCGTSGVLR